jgi:antitoxin component YwqK of YwqJK toxin-antitoxin module
MNDETSNNDIGMPDGVRKYYYDTGKIQSIENINKDGMRDGRCTKFSRDGVITFDGFFVNDVAMGEFIHRNMDGSVHKHGFHYSESEFSLNLLFQPKLTTEDKFEMSLKYGNNLWLES